MAHHCPDCDAVCKCNGDDSDTVVRNIDAEIDCSHCVCPVCHNCPEFCECKDKKDA